MDAEETQLSEAEFDSLFDLSVTEVGEGATPFVIIGDGCVGCYTFCVAGCK